MEWVIILAILAGIAYNAKQLYFKGNKIALVKMEDVPLSVHEWERFSALAIAMNKQTKTLLADAVKYYLQEKTK